MYVNRRWLTTFVGRWNAQGPNGRLAVFAHNGHVMNSANEGGIWSAFREPPSAMGKFLRATPWSRSCSSFGATAGATAGGLSPMEADPTSVDAALAQIAMPRFILDLRTARDEPIVFAWLSERRTLHANLTTHNIITPIPAFDALFFVRNPHACTYSTALTFANTVITGSAACKTFTLSWRPVPLLLAPGSQPRPGSRPWLPQSPKQPR